MRKVTLAIVAALILTACGGSNEKVEVVDSTVVADSAKVVDSAVSAVDSNASHIPVSNDPANPASVDARNVK